MPPKQSDIEYIRGLADSDDSRDNWINEKTVEIGIELLRLITEIGVDDPTIAPGPDGMLGFTWRNGPRYFNLELIPDPKTLNGYRIEWYFENLETGEQILVDI